MARTKSWTNEQFVEAWASSNNVKEVCHKLGNVITTARASNHATFLRKQGVGLMRFTAHGRQSTSAVKQLNFDCPVKNSVRSQFFCNWIRQHGSTAAKVYVCLPAEKCLCVEEAFRQGVIDQHTYIMWAERNTHTRKKISAYMESKGFSHHTGFASFNRLVKTLKIITAACHKPMVDLAFIDLCGEMSKNTKTTISDIAPLLKKGSLVGVTIQDYARHPNTLKFNTQAKAKAKGSKQIKPKKTLHLGEYDITDCTVTPGIVGHVTDALPKHKLEQLILYRSPSKPTCMSLTILT